MKKQIKLVSFLVIILTVGFSCGKDDNNTTTNTGLKLLWTLPITQNNLETYINLKDAVVYENNIFSGDEENNNRVLKSIDAGSKEVKWKWSDIIAPRFMIKKSYQFNNYLLQQVNANTYCIDLKTGKSKFNINRNEYFENWVCGIGNTFFISSYEDEAKIYIGDINTGKIQAFLTPNYKRKFPIGTYKRSIYPIAPTVYNSDTLLVIPFLEPADTGVISQIGTYNLTKKQWLYTNANIGLKNRDSTLK